MTMHKSCLLLLAAMPFAAAAEDATIIEVREKGDVLIIEETDPAASRTPVRPDRDVPTRGADMSKVRNVFGEPRQEHAAIGDPPITRWDYDGFSVFFEYDKVIHSVVTE